MRILSIILSIVLLANAAMCQERIELQNYTGEDVFVIIKDEKLNVTIGNNSNQFLLEKDKAEYRLKNIHEYPKLSELIKVDTNIVLSKWRNAYPGLSAMDMIINQAGAHSNTHGIIITKSSSDIMPTDTLEPELGGTEIVDATPDNDSGMNLNWLWYILPALLTLVIGYFVGKKSTHKIVPTENLISNDSEETVIDIKSEKDVAAAKEKMKKLNADKRKLKNEIDSLKENLRNMEINLAKNNELQSNYYGNALKELVIPFSNAATAGDKKELVALAFKMAAQFSSKARHEMKNLQDYDRINIANLLHSQIEQGNIPMIDSNFPKDKIPNYIDTIISVLNDYEVSNLGSNVIMGYKISN